MDMDMAMPECLLDLFFFQLVRGLGLWKGCWFEICDGSMEGAVARNRIRIDSS